MIDAAHIRWLTFCELHSYPRCSNEVIEAVLDNLDIEHPLMRPETGLFIADQLDYLESNGLLAVHARDDSRNLLEVRLNDADL